MYMGLPVVASDVKGHSDLVSNGGTGLLYPYGDEKACAEQIWRLIEDKGLRRQLADSAKENVAQYCLERVLPMVLEEYRELFPAGAGGRVTPI